MKILRTGSPRNINRRKFMGGSLAALGAVGLAASEQTRIAEAAGLAAPRFVFIYSPCGRHDSWRTETPGPDFKLGPTMQMFEPWKSHTTIMDGLTIPYFDYVINAHWGAAHCLLGGKSPLNKGDVKNIDGQASTGSQRTFDHLFADHFGQDTPVSNIVLGGLDKNNQMSGLELSYTGPEMPQRPIHETDALFTALFGGKQAVMPMPVGQDDIEARRQLQKWETEVLGLGQTQGVQLRTSVGREELVYLQQHEQNLSDAFRRVTERDPSAQIEVSASCNGLSLDALQQTVNSEEKNARHHDTQLSTLAAALACGRTRVGVAVMAGIRDSMRVAGSKRGHHSHCDDCHDHYLAFDDYYGKRVANFLAQLASYPEGDGTVLDNTIVVWSSDISYDAIQHDHQNHPMHLFGGLPGNKLKMGQYVQIPYFEANKKREALADTRNRRTHEVYLSIAQALGVTDLGDFGDPKYTQGPFTELLA